MNNGEYISISLIYHFSCIKTAVGHYAPDAQHRTFTQVTDWACGSPFHDKRYED